MADITVAELKQRIDSGEKINLIDVREPNEYQERNINGKLIPLASLPSRLDELESLKEEEIIIHCKSGRRSANAQQFLETQGYKNVRNVIGGIDAYLNL